MRFRGEPDSAPMPELTPQPLVSVVTPVLNRASSIDGCLSSVANQTYSRIEHIVVDGGSSDASVDVIRGFSGKYPLRWISEPDKGMYDAINKGMRMAEGDIVCYLNSDDLYFPWSVEVAVRELQRQADLVFGDLAVLQHDGGPGFYIQFYADFDLGYYTHIATIGQPTVFWTRSLFDEVGYFDDSYRLIGDCDYWLRAALVGAKIRHVNEVLAVQIEHAGTLRATNSQQLADEFARLRSTYGKHVAAPAWPYLQRLKRSLVWRKLQLQFRVEAGREDPGRWRHFIDFLRRRGVHFDDVAVVVSMLPHRFRGTRSVWGDHSKFEQFLMEETGASVR